MVFLFGSIVNNAAIPLSVISILSAVQFIMYCIVAESLRVYVPPWCSSTGIYVILGTLVGRAVGRFRSDRVGTAVGAMVGLLVVEGAAVGIGDVGGLLA